MPGCVKRNALQELGERVVCTKDDLESDICPEESADGFRGLETQEHERDGGFYCGHCERPYWLGENGVAVIGYDVR